MVYLKFKAILTKRELKLLSRNQTDNKKST